MFRPRVFKRNTKTKTKNLKDTKGDWEFSAYQKKFIPNEEQNIKKELCPENSFNPKLIPEYINPNASKLISITMKPTYDHYGHLGDADLYITNRYLQ